MMSFMTPFASAFTRLEGKAPFACSTSRMRIITERWSESRRLPAHAPDISPPSCIASSLPRDAADPSLRRSAFTKSNETLSDDWLRRWLSDHYPQYRASVHLLQREIDEVGAGVDRHGVSVQHGQLAFAAERDAVRHIDLAKHGDAARLGRDVHAPP